MRSMYMTSYMYIYSFKICFHIERASHNRSLLDHAKLRICITWCLSGTILKSHLSKYREREYILHGHPRAFLPWFGFRLCLPPLPATCWSNGRGVGGLYSRGSLFAMWSPSEGMCNACKFALQPHAPTIPCVQACSNS